MSHGSDPIQKRVEKMAAHETSINGRLKAIGQAKNILWSDSWDPDAFKFDSKPMITGVLGQGRGEMAAQSCQNCVKEDNPFHQCMIVEGHLNGACCNCFFKTRSHKCSFRTRGTGDKESTTGGDTKGQAAIGNSSNAVATSPLPPARATPPAGATPPADTEAPPNPMTTIRQENRHLSQELDQLKNELSDLTGDFSQKFDARNAIITTLIKSAGKIEDLVATRALELHKGFKGLTGDLLQIRSRVQELEDFVSETNSMIAASIDQARETCKDFLAAEETTEFDELYGKGSLENDKGIKLSFT